MNPPSSSTGSSPSDRRPLAARELPLWRNLIPKLQRLGVTPNAISGLGLLAGLASGIALAATSVPFQDPPVERLCWMAGALLILLRGACNILDGVLAVDTGQSSPTGYIWNEFPDRLSDAATLIGAGYAAGGCPEAGWLAALAAVITAYTRLVARLAGAEMDFRGPMAKPMRMGLVFAAAVFGAVAPSAWQNPPWPGHRPGWMVLVLWLVSLGCGATILRRLRHASRQLERSVS